MKVIVHYPQTEQGKQKLEKAVTGVHIHATVKYISKLNWPKEQKEKLLEDIVKEKY